MPIEEVLVTGGAGFIGSRLCRALVDSGVGVVVFDNLSFGREEHLSALGERCRLIRGDIRDSGLLDRVVQEVRPKRVFHLAALHYIPYCNDHPVETVEVNINGTRNLLDACRRAQPGQIAFASTAAVYPLLNGPFTENEKPRPVDIYGHTKLVGEELTRLFNCDTGVPSLVCRFFNAIGPNETNPHLVPAIVDQLKSGSSVLRLGNLDPVRDYIHVDDMVNAIMLLSAPVQTGYDIYNLGSGQGYNVREVVAAFENAMGADLIVEQEVSRVRKVDRPELVADVSKLRRNTSWVLRTDLNGGVRRLVESLGLREDKLLKPTLQPFA